MMLPSAVTGNGIIAGSGVSEERSYQQQSLRTCRVSGVSVANAAGVMCCERVERAMKHHVVQFGSARGTKHWPISEIPVESRPGTGDGSEAGAGRGGVAEAVGGLGKADQRAVASFEFP
jgi:hypothetical protein